MPQVWAMKLTESTNICYVSDRVPFAIKMNVKETFMENDSFYICLCGEWTAVRVKNTYYLTNLVFREGRTDSCCSLPTLGNPWTHVKQG